MSSFVRKNRRARKMLLSVAAVGAGALSACSSNDQALGFYGEVAMDAGGDASNSFHGVVAMEAGTDADASSVTPDAGDSGSDGSDAKYEGPFGVVAVDGGK